MQKPLIGFIGQGFIGRHMADDFENRGYKSVRYSVDEPYVQNKDKIASCDITFIAVPTPTTPQGFDASIIQSVLPLIGKGKTAVIKSTVLPGTTERFQADFPDILIMHSPEFLREASAAEDTAHPERNIVGIPKETSEYRERGGDVLAVLPPAPFNTVTTSRNAECVKYIGNAYLYTKLVFMNIAHDFVKVAGANWEEVRNAVIQDSRIGAGHTNVMLEGGRGAGGHCFIKDFEAFLEYYAASSKDTTGLKALESLRAKNNDLLLSTKKDLDLLYGVYGDDVPV